MSRWDAYRGRQPQGTPLDPCPKGGLVERVACMHYARFGYWPADFIGHVQRAYGGIVPSRFVAYAKTLRAEQAWEAPADPDEGHVRVTLLERDGSIRQVYRVPAEEFWS